MDSKQSFFRYLPTYPGIEDWGSRVLDAGFAKVGKNTDYPPPGHPEDHHFTWEKGRRMSAWTFVYITAGSGEFESECSAPATVEAGDVFVVFPGVWHRYRPLRGVGWDEYWVEADGKLLRYAIARAGLSSAQPILRVGHDEGLLRCFCDVIESIRDEQPGFQVVIGMQVLVMLSRLTSLQQKAREKGTTNSERLVRQAILLMRANLGESMPMDGIALKLGTSYTSFRRVFRKVTGRAPGDYFLEMKINRAKQLLEIPSKSIQEISYELGCDSVSHFSTLFKARTGSCPSDFRKK